MKRLSWHNIVFGCKNQIMVAVTKIFESGPIKSRVGAFPDVLGITNGRFKGTESRSEPRVRFRLVARKSDYYWCVFVK